MVNIILLSGGSGKRLWPLSNNVRSKQFIKLFKREDGIYESMVQRVYRQIMSAAPEAKITIATSKSQASELYNQLGNKVHICVEPARRDTFPAIVLAAAFLHDKEQVGKEEVLLVCPVDPYVDDQYFDALKQLVRLAEQGSSNLVLMGMEPTYPSEKYGYIIPETRDDISRVAAFKEKPDLGTAKRYIESGALWNGGVFAFKLGYLMDQCFHMTGFASYQELYSRYEELEKISFDYAVVEHEKDIMVMRFSEEWKDIGTWNTLTEEMTETVLGKGVLDKSCENTHIINELNIPVLGLGLKDIVVSASGNGILVSTKDQSSHIKPFVESFDQRVMFAEKSWGSFTIIDVGEDSLTIKVVLHAGSCMNYHSHQYRDEVWTVTNGQGTVVIDGMQRMIRPGDVITMPAGCKHTVMADAKLQLIEVQLGKDISVQDKIKYNLEEELKRKVYKLSCGCGEYNEKEG